MKTFNYKLKNINVEEIINFSDYINEKNVLIQIFCGESKTRFQNIIETLCKELPQAVCIGATSDGEIEASNVYTQNTVISVSVFKHTSIKGSFKTSLSSYENGVDLTTDIITPNSKVLLLFASVLNTNGDEFLKGVENVNDNIIIAGGIASTASDYKNSFVSFGNRLFNSGMVGVSLNSDILKVHNDFRFNWMPVGTEHIITKVEENRVYTIDNINAVDFYKKYLGSEIMHSLYEDGTQFPLIILSDDIPRGRVVIDKDNESLTFNGNFEKNDIVKFGFGQAEIIMKEPYTSYQNLLLNHAESFFIYSCMARRRYLPKNIHLEIEPLAYVATTSGFFTHGEFYHHKNSNKFLNHTLTVISLSESDEKAKEYQIMNKPIITNSEHVITIQALTRLIEQSSIDYYKLHDELESRVEERTFELLQSNEKLKHTLQNLEQTQNELLNAEKMATLGELVSSVTHEINTPLGLSITLSTHLEFLNNNIRVLYNDNNISEEEFKKYLNQVDESTKMITSNLTRSKELVNSFKNIAVDQATEDKRVFNLKKYIEEILIALNVMIQLN